MGRIRDYLAATSVDSQGGDGADRRRARRKAVFLRATIYPIDVFCDARIRDVSTTGIMGEADVELALGQTLHITLDEQSYHAGVVKWTRGRQFGVDLPNALAVLGNNIKGVDHGCVEGHQPRAPRIKVNVTARLVAGRPPRPATIRNLSVTGMLLDTSPGLRPGQQLVVRIGNAPPVYGRLQWNDGSKIGFKAQCPLPVFTIACALD